MILLLYILSVIYSGIAGVVMLLRCDYYVSNSIFFIIIIMTPLFNILFALGWTYEVWLVWSLKRGLKDGN